MNAAPTPPPAPQSGPADRLEQQVRALLAEGKFRKARDEAKQLRKLDRARGLPLLIEANVGLARSMLAKGLVADAEQVLAYLATLAPPADLAAIRAEFAGRSGDFGAAVPTALQLLADPAASAPEAERWRAADLLVLAFEEVPATSPATAGVLAELRGIHEALRAVSARQWSAALEALRPLSQRSAFRHWKWLLKGWIAFYQGDAARAERAFAELPAGTLPAKAAAPCRLLLGTAGAGTSSTLPAQDVLEGACRLLGEPGLGRLLHRAEELWRQRRSGASYLALREGCGRFPSEQPDLVGALTDFYYHSLFRADRAMTDGLLECFGRVLDDRRPGKPLERALMLRVLGLFDPEGTPPFELKSDWEHFLATYEQIHGPNPRLASLAWSWLGQRLMGALSRRDVPYFGRAAVLRDARGAIEILQRSLALDPGNLEAAVSLCDLYDRLRKFADRNRLLDEMVRQFPENKAVLLRAARRCVDRKAFAKGLGYLERARALDLLDPALIGEMARALFGQAGDWFRKQRPEAAREALDRALGLAVDQPGNLTCARWCLLAWRAAIENAVGNPALVEALLTQAQASCPSPEALLLYAHLAQLTSQRARSHEPTRFSHAFVKFQLKSASAHNALLLVRIQSHWDQRRPDNVPHSLDGALVIQYLEAARRHPFTVDDVRRLAEQVGAQNPLSLQVIAFVRECLRRDPKNPWCRLYQLTGEIGRYAADPADVRVLREIIEEAARRGDSETAQRAKQWIDRPPPPPPEPWGSGSVPDFDVDAESDPEDEEYRDLPGPGDPGSSDAAMLAETLALLAGLSEGDRRRAKKQMTKQGMPGFVFDLLAEAARTGGPVPDFGPEPEPGRPRPNANPPPPPKPPAPPRPTADPNQLDLF